MAQENWDRIKFAPQHNGRNVPPCMVCLPFKECGMGMVVRILLIMYVAIVTRLLRLAHRKPLKVAVRDVRANTERTYLELLTDVLTFRERMKDNFLPDFRCNTERRRDIHRSPCARRI